MADATRIETVEVALVEQLRAGLQALFGELFGVPAVQVPPDATFLELGADSLFLLRASQRIQDRFGVRVPFRRMIEELTTVDALAAGLGADPACRVTLRSLPGPPAGEPPAAVAESGRGVMAPAAGPPAEELAARAPGPAADPLHEQAAASGDARPATGFDLESILAGQLQLMERQLDLLTGGRRAARPAPGRHPGRAAPRPAVAPAVPVPAAPPATEIFVPYQPIDRTPAGELDRRQRSHLAALARRLAAKTRRSKELAQASRRVLANSRASAGFRLLWKELVYPLVGHRGDGAYIWDVDGNRYLDLTMGFGSLLFGHSPDFLRQALAAQLDLGVQVGPESETAGEVAALICELTGAERATFCNSGTEAVMAALRLARAVTGRPKIALFAGSFHGTFDGLLAQGERRPDGSLQAAPLSPGVPPSLIEDVLVLDYEGFDSLAVVAAHAGELAAVLVEPRQSRRPDLDRRDLLAQLRTLTERAGIALVFDEVVTGFRAHPGGIQALYGVRADITTYGKAVANGMPIGVVAGKATYLDAVDGGYWSYGDRSLPEAGTTFFGGTFFRHPLVMAAALACLRQIKARPGLQEELNRRTARLVAALAELFANRGLPVGISHFSSFFVLDFPSWTARDLFFFHLLDRGIYVWERRICYLSTAHGDQEVERIVEAAADSLREMEEGGFLAGAPGERQVGPPRGEPAAATAASLPLTEGQRELWELAQGGEDACRALNLALALDLRGPLDRTALERTLQLLADRHEALRLTFAADGESQSIARRRQASIAWTDLAAGGSDAGAAPAPGAADALATLAAEARRSFDLARGPLLRWHLLRLAADHHVLGLCVHHLAIDGGSLSILLAELAALYAAEAAGEPPALPPPQPYRHAVAAVREREQAAAMATDEAYWLRQLLPLPPPLALPADRPRPPRRTFAGDLRSTILPPELSAALKQLAVRLGCTSTTLWLAAIAALLHRLTGQDDLLVGLPVNGHPEGAVSLVGYFLRLVAVRFRFAPGVTFAGLAAAARKAVLDGHEHSEYPFRRLVHRLGLERIDSRPPLVAALFNFDVSSPLEMRGFEVEAQTVASGAVEFEIFWNVVEARRSFEIECWFNTDLLDAATVERWQTSLCGLLAGVVAAPEQAVAAIDLAGPAAASAAASGRHAPAAPGALAAAGGPGRG
jgi:glutamate-1-semialdehyde aminotransferase/acyl carrier protein